VTWDDLNNKSPEQILSKIADGFKNSKNRGEALGAVIEILGKSGKTMAAGFAEGAAGLEKLSKEANKLSTEDVAAIDAAGDKLNAMMNSITVTASKAFLAVSKVFNPEEWANGKATAGNFTLPTEKDFVAPSLIRKGGEAPKSKEKLEEEKQIRETIEKHSEEAAKLNFEMLEQQRESAMKYMSVAEKIRTNEERIAHLKEMAKGNDNVRTAELNKQISALQAQTLEMRVQQNLMTPNERREQQREKNRVDRARTKAERQIEHEGREDARHDREQGLPPGTTRMGRKGADDLKGGKIAPVDFSDSSVAKFAKAVVAGNAQLLTK
jgi:hypothetical protein